MDTSIHGPLPPFVVFLVMGLLCVLALLCLLLRAPHQPHPYPHLLTFSFVFTLIFLSAGCVLSWKAFCGNELWARRLWVVDSFFIICDVSIMKLSSEDILTAQSVYVISGMTYEIPMAIGFYRVSQRVWYLIASFSMAIELSLLCFSFSLRGWLQIAAVAIHNFSNALWCWNYPRLFLSCIGSFSLLFLIYGFEIAFWTVYLFVFLGCVVFEQVYKRTRQPAAPSIPLEPLGPRQSQVSMAPRKICLIGPSGVGKTWLINNYFSYDIPYEPTLEDEYTVFIRLDQELIRSIVLDTGDPEKYSEFIKDWIASGDVCVIPLTNSESLEIIKRMKLGFLGKKPVLLLGMRKGNGQVHDLEARSFAFEHGWDYRHRYDGDPFEYVARVYFSRPTEGL